MEQRIKIEILISKKIRDLFLFPLDNFVGFLALANLSYSLLKLVKKLMQKLCQA